MEKHDQQGRPDPKNWARLLGLMTVIVTDLVAYSGAGVGLGYLLYVKLGAPWWVLIPTTGAGLGLAMYQIYKRARSL